MESRSQFAAERHTRGYNCAQAVACTYADLVGMDEVTLFKACEGLGLGMGGMEGTCGALSGACMLAGLVNSTGDLAHPTSKGSTYALSRQMVSQFASETGVVLTPCPRCIEIACDLVEKTLFSGRDV